MHSGIFQYIFRRVSMILIVPKRIVMISLCAICLGPHTQSSLPVLSAFVFRIVPREDAHAQSPYVVLYLHTQSPNVALSAQLCRLGLNPTCGVHCQRRAFLHGCACPEPRCEFCCQCTQRAQMWFFQIVWNLPGPAHVDFISSAVSIRFSELSIPRPYMWFF